MQNQNEWRRRYREDQDSCYKLVKEEEDDEEEQDEIQLEKGILVIKPRCSSAK